jgi:hypothetical protein
LRLCRRRMAGSTRRYPIASAGQQLPSTRSAVWKNRNLRLRTKGNVYRVAVVSNLVYGAETWAPTQCQQQRLHAFHMGCLRRIMGVSRLQHIPNVKVLAACGQQDIDTLLCLSRCRWLGHLERMTADRLPSRCCMQPAWREVSRGVVGSGSDGRTK